MCIKTTGISSIVEHFLINPCLALVAFTMTDPGTGSSAIPSENYETQKFLWYEPELNEVEPQARDLLENYSHIPSDEVVQHVNSLV